MHIARCHVSTSLSLCTMFCTIRRVSSALKLVLQGSPSVGSGPISEGAFMIFRRGTHLVGRDVSRAFAAEHKISDEAAHEPGCITVRAAPGYALEGNAAGDRAEAGRVDGCVPHKPHGACPAMYHPLRRDTIGQLHHAGT